MTLLFSTHQDLGPVTLPAWQGRRKYMHTFNPRDPVMAIGFDDYLDTVASLCEAAKVYAVAAHMTVDEKIVEVGMSQRRPGPHVDGRFIPSKMSWGHDGGGGSWAHYCNEIPHSRMSIIVAASIAGCKVYDGEFDSQPRNDGDLTHIQGQLGQGVLLPANRGYLLSPDCIHESIIFDRPTKRTFLRIAFAS